MTLRLYNTLASSIQDFVPLHDKDVTMYVCGPTVYDYCHMGHARAYIVFDVLRRYLKYKGFNVKYVQNFTDVDDKILRRAKENNEKPLEMSARFIKAYFDDMDRLNVLRADIHPKVSENIPEIIEMIKKLVEYGNAYESEGSVYFSVDSMKQDVGALSHQSYDSLKVGARIEADERKRNPMDFVLWKASKPGEEIAWDSPWGKGRPGWHIECSVMSMKYLGENIDIHGGGMDLIFPHHESEILQSEAFTRKPPFAKYWVHNGFLMVNKEKMSKSLGNFFTVRDILKRFPPEVVRFFILNTHYQSPLDFSDAGLDEARRSLTRIQNAVIEAEVRQGQAPDTGNRDPFVTACLEESKKKFEAVMDDNLNTREAIAEVFELTRDVNKWLANSGLSKQDWKDILGAYDTYSGILGVSWKTAKEGDELTSGLLNLLVDIRAAVRKKKDYETSDLIRSRLKDLGITIEDSKEGVRIKRIP